MIAYLNGIYKMKNEKSIIVDVNGVGYEVFTTVPLAASLEVGARCELFIYTSVKETAIELYGFSSHEDQKIFLLLLNVSGIGPKSALNIFKNVSGEVIMNAILMQQPALLATHGVGKKTAEKIVSELKAKVHSVEFVRSSSGDHTDLIDALIALGYNQSQINHVLTRLPHHETITTEEKVRLALQLL